MFVLKDNIKLLQRTTHPKTVPLNRQLTYEMVAYDSSTERTVILLLKSMDLVYTRSESCPSSMHVVISVDRFPCLIPRQYEKTLSSTTHGATTSKTHVEVMGFLGEAWCEI